MEIFEFISYKDLLDILGTSLFVYGVLYFLRITKGIQILKGLVLLALIWALSSFLDLKTVSTIFEKLWTVGLFSLVVIFQPEIRKALIKLGQATKLTSSKPLEERVVERLVRACAFMSERQIGALIVIERNQDLEPLLEGCVTIDAVVSLELLITLFDPLTPLHDGAVVIRGYRIAYASCVLPLSKSSEIPKKYGTRHRAGLGISEESDAIAVMVSEETGEISVAVGGRFHRNLDRELLKSLLLKELGINL
jgi:diadenylate cyclase